MAITATVLSASQHVLKLLLTHDQNTATDTLTISNATLLGYLADGPLQTLFTRPGAGGAAFATQAAARAGLTEGPNMDVPLFCSRDTAASPAAWACDVNIDGNGAPTVVIQGDAASSPQILELSFRHSIVR